MKKHFPDATDFEGTYRAPPHIAAMYDEIVQRSKATYPDHGESRDQMVRQEILKAWDASHRMVAQLGTMVSDQQRVIERYESTKADPWWKFW